MTEKVWRGVRVTVWHQQCEDSCQSARFFFAKLGFQDKIFGDVYFTLFALKSPKTLLGIKKNCIFAKDLILKAEFLKKIWLIDTSLHTVDVTQ